MTQDVRWWAAGAGGVAVVAVGFIRGAALLGPILVLLALVTGIVLVHMVAYNRHEKGLFAQWTEPGKLFSGPLQEKEKRLLHVVLILLAAGALSIVIITMR